MCSKDIDKLKYLFILVRVMCLFLHGLHLVLGIGQNCIVDHQSCKTDVISYKEVAGSTPAEVGNILSWKLIMKYFLSLPLIQEGQLSVSGKRMCTILVNRLED